jgi:hypothetical protein
VLSDDDNNNDDDDEDLEFLAQPSEQVAAAATNAFRIVTPDRILDIGATNGIIFVVCCCCLLQLNPM